MCVTNDPYVSVVREHIELMHDELCSVSLLLCWVCVSVSNSLS